jgi:hypothetical protein
LNEWLAMTCRGPRILLLKAKLLSFLAIGRLAEISALNTPTSGNVSRLDSAALRRHKDSEAKQGVQLRKIKQRVTQAAANRVYLAAMCQWSTRSRPSFSQLNQHVEIP